MFPITFPATNTGKKVYKKKNLFSYFRIYKINVLGKQMTDINCPEGFKRRIAMGKGAFSECRNCWKYSKQESEEKLLAHCAAPHCGAARNYLLMDH